MTPFELTFENLSTGSPDRVISQDIGDKSLTAVRQPANFCTDKCISVTVTTT